MVEARVEDLNVRNTVWRLMHCLDWYAPSRLFEAGDYLMTSVDDCVEDDRLHDALRLRGLRLGNLVCRRRGLELRELEHDYELSVQGHTFLEWLGVFRGRASEPVLRDAWLRGDPPYEPVAPTQPGCSGSGNDDEV